LPTETQPDSAQQIADSIRSHGRAFFRVLGTSMSPAVPSESIVNVVAVDIGSVKTGALVAFLRDDRIFVHRVVSAHSGGGVVQLVTRGDALASDDPPITSLEFLGAVTAVIPPGKRSLTRRVSARLRTLFAE
jgi:hypothetical protein